MDIVTLEMAKQYADSQQVARTKITEHTLFNSVTVAAGGTNCSNFPVADQYCKYGRNCVVTVNGVEHRTKVAHELDDGTMYIGNAALWEGHPSLDTGEGFCITVSPRGQEYNEIVFAQRLEEDTEIRCDIEVETIKDQYLPDTNMIVNLADYGVNIFALFGQGGGQAELTNADRLWERVLATDGTVMLHGEFMGMALKAPLSQVHSEAPGLTGTIPMFANGTPVAVYLYIVGDTVTMKVSLI